AKTGNSKIGLPEVNLGVLPGMGGTQRLPRLIGNSRAMELMALGRAISFEQGLEYGLINQIFDSEGYWEKILEYARNFVPPKKASLSVGLIKRAIKSGTEMSLPDGLALEREVLQRAFESADSQEGLKAYLEKRAANFKGK
ncbi:MAG: enoyl-CoA hydratase/isomerase family protein, partial [bacterium]